MLDTRNRVMQNKIVIHDQGGRAVFEHATSNNTVAKTLSEAVKQGVSLANVVLSDLDLTGVDLTGIDLTNSRVINCKLSKAGLSNSICVGTVFENCDLSYVDATQSNWSEAKIIGSKMVKSDFYKTALRGSTISGVDALGITLDFADLSGAKISKTGMRIGCLGKVNARNAQFSDVDFSNAGLEGMLTNSATTFEKIRIYPAAARNFNIPIPDSGMVNPETDEGVAGFRQVLSSALEAQAQAPVSPEPETPAVEEKQGFSSLFKKAKPVVEEEPAPVQQKKAAEEPAPLDDKKTNTIAPDVNTIAPDDEVPNPKRRFDLNLDEFKDRPKLMGLLKNFQNTTIGSVTSYYKGSDMTTGSPVFSDNGKEITVHAPLEDEDSVLASLVIAAQKWGSIRVNGTDEYKALCAKFAAQYDLPISNPELQDVIAKEKSALKKNSKPAASSMNM